MAAFDEKGPTEIPAAHDGLMDKVNEKSPTKDDASSPGNLAEKVVTAEPLSGTPPVREPTTDRGSKLTPSGKISPLVTERVELAKLKPFALHRRLIAPEPEAEVESVDELLEEYKLESKGVKTANLVPDILVHVVDGDWWVVDGMDRVEAERKLGRTTINAAVVESTMKEAILAAAQANARHGRKRSPAAKWAVIYFLLHCEELSQEERGIKSIERIACVSRQLVRRVMELNTPTMPPKKVPDATSSNAPTTQSEDDTESDDDAELEDDTESDDDAESKGEKIVEKREYAANIGWPFPISELPIKIIEQTILDGATGLEHIEIEYDQTVASPAGTEYATDTGLKRTIIDGTYSATFLPAQGVVRVRAKVTASKDAASRKESESSKDKGVTP